MMLTKDRIFFVTSNQKNLKDVMDMQMTPNQGHIGGEFTNIKQYRLAKCNYSPVFFYVLY